MTNKAYVLTRCDAPSNQRGTISSKLFVDLLETCNYSVVTGHTQPNQQFLSKIHTCFIDANFCYPHAMFNMPLIKFYPNVNKVIFNANETDHELHYAALQSGINGIFHKEDSLDLIVKGIQQVQTGNKWFSREIMSRFINANLAASQKPARVDSKPDSVLTKRELSITEKIVEGAQNQEIADSFHISVNTVKTHIYSIFRKTECRNRVELIKWFNLKVGPPQNLIS